MVKTSDGNLAAWREAVSFHQLAEIPLVLLHTQHLAPGLSPTPLLGDVDIVLARHLGFGGLPLPVLAATDPSSARTLIERAIEIADGLRTPVIVLLSADVLANEVLPNRAATVRERSASTPELPLPRARASTNETTLTARRLDREVAPECVSFAGEVDGRRAFLHLREDEIDTHLQRLRDKLLNAGEILESTTADPDPEAETVLVSYGHADRAARRAVKIVRENKARVSHLTIHSLWPLPRRAFKRAVTPFVRRVLLPELNMGLYADELSKVLRSIKIESTTRCDGRPIEPETIARRITDWPCG
jgi:2-oxoglutarate ferredoxin oxidoreductase subunit alpha